MAQTTDAAIDGKGWLGRAASNLFKLLFGLAVVIAAGATYLAVTDQSPDAAGQPGLFWLLIANLVLIAGVAAVLGLRVFQLRIAGKCLPAAGLVAEHVGALIGVHYPR